MPLALLPPNATPLMRAVSEADARILDVPTEDLRAFKDPATCPDVLLPYLALERAVHEWDPAWDEATKRAVVAASYGVHQRAGTAGAMTRALAAFGADIVLLEWFQYGGQPYRFRVRHQLAEGEPSDLVKARQVIRVARSTKNVRSRMEHFEIAARGPSASPHLATASHARIRCRAIAA